MKDYEVLPKYFINESKDNKKKINDLKSSKIGFNDVENFLKEYKFDNLLDVGYGNFYLINLLYKHKEADYNGLYSSADMLKIAKLNLGSEANLIHGSADNIPFNDNTFDVVTCVESFHNYIYPQQVIKEIHRVLKPNGICILSDTGHSGLSKWIDNNFIMTQVAKSGNHPSYTRNDVENIMKNNRFCIRKSYDLSKNAYTVIGQKL